MADTEQHVPVRSIPNSCCAGGWWLSGEMPPADEDAQPETD